MPITPISPVFSNISKPIVNNTWNSQYMTKHMCTKTSVIDIQKNMPWLKDKIILEALAELKDINFSSDDIDYLKLNGINTPFKSGAETVNFLKNQNTRIMFEKTTEPTIHAQYDYDKNVIIINSSYKKNKDFAVTLAIAEAILHEAGHAKDNDGESSIQEELDFLGMNAIAHRAFLKKYGNIFSDSQELIVKDGVSIYAKLFFDNDPKKTNLIERISSKYGELPSGDRIHPPSKLSREIKQKYLQNT